MKRSHLFLLGLMLLIGLLFRTYKIVDRFEFAHDGDLYSWIVKDIVVNHHFRLIGQLTSAPGIFIGPFFYYLLVPFFILFKMDPVGALVPATLVGLATIFSFYLVFSKLFKKEVGLIGAFLYTVLITTVGSDRWVVPTITTSLWTIWYLYTVLKLAEGNFSVLILLGILTGLIWHVHIALIPVLLAVPAAVLVSKKKPSFKQVSYFAAAFLITSLPLILFETRHHFSQTIALVNNFLTHQPGPSGLFKFRLVLAMVAKNLNALLFTPQSFPSSNLLLLTIILSPIILIREKLLNLKQLWTLSAWVLGVILFFSLSSSPVSEYYFANLDIFFLLVVSLLLYLLYKLPQTESPRFSCILSFQALRHLMPRNLETLLRLHPRSESPGFWRSGYKTSRFGKVTVLILLTMLMVKNSYFMVTQHYYNKGYVEKKATVTYIAEDAKSKGFPCVGISYITAPGENVGFRYFFYLNGIHLVHPSLNVPVYNIVIPDELGKGEKVKYGHIGIIPPENIPAKEKIDKSCQTPNTNLTDPVFGYVE